MPHDWIPKPDAQFDDLVQQFRTWLATPANATAAGISTGEITALGTAADLWDTNFADKKTYDQQGASITLAKQQARTALEAALRPLAELLRTKRKLGALTDAQLAAAGVPPADPTPTASAPPTTRPLVNIDASQRLQHIYHWRDEASPASKAKPPGVRHAELRLALTAPGAAAPADPDAFTAAQATDTATPYLAVFDPADGGKTAHVLARWVSTRGDAGPWSLPASATILA